MTTARAANAAAATAVDKSAGSPLEVRGSRPPAAPCGPEGACALLSGWGLRKPGFCPRLDPDMMTICLVECGSDSDCKGNEKCCSMGCHSFSLSTAKPGVCPKRKVLQTLVACNNTCSDDTDCPGSNKCCFTGCSRGCVNNNFAA
uniref:WAP domain-containing protein n=1 Tax=Anser brachyrhynchus TaxID=132585 RepID=A0A8B9BV18_9AVES